MKVHLFHDKQVMHLVQSVKRNFNTKFKEALEIKEALLDAEVKNQMDSDKIKEVREKRAAKRANLEKIQSIENQLKEIDSNYTVAKRSWRLDDVHVNLIDFDKETEEQVLNVATGNAKRILGIDEPDYRKNCLIDDITARIAVMAVTDYDSVVSKLEADINIENYFITL